MSERKTKVLWVEDDPDYVKGFIGCYDEVLDITQVDNWEMAQSLLEKDYFAFEAIILDARCKNTPDGLDNSKKFMVKAFRSLSALMEKNSRILPWYVLSGGDKEDISDLIDEERKKWDCDRPEPYYCKDQDEDILVKRINAYCRSHNPIMLQLKNVLFPDLFAAIAQLDIKEWEDHMMYLLRPFADPSVQYDIQGACSKVRNIVENMFEDMSERGLLPEAVRRSNGGINMEWCSIVLAGEPKEIKKQDKLQRLYESGALECPLFGMLPKIMAKNLQTIYKTCCNVAHDKSKQASQNRTYRYKEYQKLVGNTPYLLRSFALQLSDLIILYHNWLNTHLNK